MAKKRTTKRSPNDPKPRTRSARRNSGRSNDDHITQGLLSEDRQDLRDAVRLRWNVTVAFMLIVAGFGYAVIRNPENVAAIWKIAGISVVVIITGVHAHWQYRVDGRIRTLIRRCGAYEQSLSMFAASEVTPETRDVSEDERLSRLSMLLLVAITSFLAVVLSTLIVVESPLALAGDVTTPTGPIDAAQRGILMQLTTVDYVTAIALLVFAIVLAYFWEFRTKIKTCPEPLDMEVDDESLWEIYRQKYNQFRHLDNSRWRIPAVVFAIGAAILTFASSETSDPPQWAVGVFGLVSVLSSFTMHRISGGLDYNRNILEAVAKRLGDRSVPAAVRRFGASWWFKYSILFIGLAAIFVMITA